MQRDSFFYCSHSFIDPRVVIKTNIENWCLVILFYATTYFLCSCLEIYFFAIDWSLRVSVKNLSISTSNVLNEPIIGWVEEKVADKKRATTIFVSLFKRFYWFSFQYSVSKNGGNIFKTFYSFHKLHSEANLIMVSFRVSALPTKMFAAQFVSPSSLEVVKQKFITIIYRDEKKIMQDPLKCEQRTEKKILIKNSNWYQSCLTSGHNLKITIYIKVPTTASDAFEKKIFIATPGLPCN